MIETHKIIKIYEKEFDGFTAFNLMVNRQGDKIWLNGYMSKENRAWKKGDTVSVELWYDEEGERWKYKPADEGSQQSQPNQQSQSGPPRNSGSGLKSSPDGVSNAELKHLLVKIGKFLAKMDEKLDALDANTAPQNHSDIGPYINNSPHPAEQPEQSSPQAPWDTIDDDLPF